MYTTLTELSDVMRNMGDVLSLEETEELIAEADIDGDGNVNYEEFVAMIFKGVKNHSNHKYLKIK